LGRCGRVAAPLPGIEVIGVGEGNDQHKK